jgi:glutamine synthetase
MSDYTKKISDLINEHDIEFVDFRFTDMVGKWHHISLAEKKFSLDISRDGIGFDGSSIPGWKEINESDMIIKPDNSVEPFLDPFTAQPTIVLICDVIDPVTNQPYDRDPRYTARKAEQYLRTSNIAEKAFFGPELEFFVFDNIRFANNMHESFVFIDHEEGPYNSGRQYDSGNFGHRNLAKGSYASMQPFDLLHDIRAEILTTLRSVNMEPTIHHHEVASSQCEINFDFSTLLESADNVQKCKHVIKNVVHSYGKTASFMPKPMKGENGSGMHVHQSLWDKESSLFAGETYANLSELALYYIGGIIKHAKAISAFANPTTNSYKRLVPGFEAPVYLAYSARNRSAAIRVPHANSEKGRRIEVRFPDPTANPYFLFAAMLMAGLDGIENKIHPGEASENNLYHLSPKEMMNMKMVSTSLYESLGALVHDRAFLTKGGVFTDAQLDAYINVKHQEAQEVEQSPHPAEFLLYYGL